MKEGLVSEDIIDQMCRNILLAKYRLGLFEDPFRYEGAERFAKAIYRPENMEIARSLARESMVLLKNNDDVLPLENGERIALIGPYINCGKSMIGTWTAFGEIDRAVTIEAGFKERFPGKVNAVNGCDPYNHIEGGMAQAVRAARNADVAVLTLGLHGNISGESSSLTTVELPQVQKELLAAVKATGKPVVVLLVTGRAMALESVENLMDACMVVWHPGTMGGTAVADLVSGDFSPSGHLVMSFPRCDGQIPIRYNYKNTGRPTDRVPPAPTHKCRKPFNSSYMFTPNSPLYPFGYGLSYTKFEFTALEIPTPEVKMGENVTVKAVVRNTGKVDGATVAQLYIRDLVASTTRPLRELKGFKKVYLKAGESADLEFTLTPEDLAFCREDMKYAQEPGEFSVWVGDSSEAELTARFLVK